MSDTTKHDFSKPNVIHLRVSDDERAAYAAAAEAKDLDVSKWLRALARRELGLKERGGR